jgi:hypothetical protein
MVRVDHPLDDILAAYRQFAASVHTATGDGLIGPPGLADGWPRQSANALISEGRPGWRGDD